MILADISKGRVDAFLTALAAKLEDGFSDVVDEMLTHDHSKQIVERTALFMWSPRISFVREFMRNLGYPYCHDFDDLTAEYFKIPKYQLQKIIARVRKKAGQCGLSAPFVSTLMSMTSFADFITRLIERNEGGMGFVEAQEFVFEVNLRRHARTMCRNRRFTKEQHVKSPDPGIWLINRMAPFMTYKSKLELFHSLWLVIDELYGKE